MQFFCLSSVRVGQMLLEGKMSKKCKVNWSDIDGASPKPKRLHLEKDETDSLYHCPIQECDHDGFQSQRGCRKHVNIKHSWFFYFDEKPNSKEITDSLKVASNFLIESTIQDQTRETTKHAVKLLPSFSLSYDIGEVFTKWLTGSGGGYKKDRAAQQIVTRCFKFLRFCCEDEEELTFDVKFHQPRYENTVKICKSSPAQVNPSDLTFATKFVAMYLFIKVKGSRPMTYQYLTVNMIATAKEKGGFIDQKTFKTAGKYEFDSLIPTDADIQVLNGYISYVRPLLKPQCDFVLVNRNGGQHGKLGDIMSKLVFDAIGKYIHPTRYRQIVETQSFNELTSEEQRILSEDQKHSSAVAKVHYQKKRSREVALKGHECLQKLQDARGSEVDEDVHARLGESTSEAGPSVERVQNISSSPKKDGLRKRILRSQTNIRRVLKFTTEEDEFLKKGITKHGFGQWTAILRDDDFQFQDGRTADSLKKRAGMKMPLA